MNRNYLFNQEVWLIFILVRRTRLWNNFPCCPSFLAFVLSYYVSLRSEFCVVMSITISAKKRCSVRLDLQLFVGGLMSYLRYLWLFAYNDIQYLLSFVCLRLMYPMLPISLDCSFVIALLLFSNIYLINCISWNYKYQTYIHCCIYIYISVTLYM